VGSKRHTLRHPNHNGRGSVTVWVEHQPVLDRWGRVTLDGTSDGNNNARLGVLRSLHPLFKMSPALKKKGRDDLGAGLKISKPEGSVPAHPAGPPRYGELTQAERAFTLASTFLSGVLAYAIYNIQLIAMRLTTPQNQRITILGCAPEAHRSSIL
jgi:hypothetical protein